MLNTEEIRALGSVINHTWGKSSTNVSPSMSLTCSIDGDVLIMKYVTIISLVGNTGYREQCKSYEDESIKACNEYLKFIKKDFKEIAGRSLKTKQLNTDDGVELITASPYSPRKTAYYRRNCLFQIS